MSIHVCLIPALPHKGLLTYPTTVSDLANIMFLSEVFFQAVVGAICFTAVIAN